jgi:carotenoid cleavage dioxygenase-like enzyme
MAGHFRATFQRPDAVSTDTTNGSMPPVSRTFDDPGVSGFMRPVRFEGEINNLEVIGEIPKEINGTFYRVMPEPQFPAFVPNDPVCQTELLPYKFGADRVSQWFNGDGNIGAFRFKDGHVDFKQRYVRTEKFVREAEARRALLGKDPLQISPYLCIRSEA